MRRIYHLILIIWVSNISFAQGTFTPVTYTAKPVDMSSLQRSLQQQEERANKASDAYAQLCEIIGDAFSQIHQDKETQLWFDENIRSMAKEVKMYMDGGNYGAALRNAIRYKGEIKVNSELIARIKTNKEYTEIRELILNRKDLSLEEKKDWEKTYPYKFVPMKDKDGHIIGGYEWRSIGGPNNTPVVIP